MFRIVFCILFISFSMLFAQHRGLWIVRNTLNTREDLRLLEEIDQAINLTDVYLQVRALGKNVYRLSDNPANNGNSVSLTEIVNFCRKNNIRVHAWINTLYIWSDIKKPANFNHPYLTDQNHLMTDAEDNLISLKKLKKLGIEGYFVDPDASINMSAIKRLIKSLLINYEMDGVHLDYTRYPPIPVSYSKHLRAKFMRDYYVDPAKVSQLLAGSADMRYRYVTEEYGKFLQKNLSQFVGELYRYVKEIDPEAVVSAAVKPDWQEAKSIYFQDWLEWLRTEKSDNIIIMNYTPDYKEFKKNLKMAKSLKYDDRIICGIGAYYLNKYELSMRIRDVEKEKLNGYCLFSFTTIKEQPDILQLITRRKSGR